MSNAPVFVLINALFRLRHLHRVSLYHGVLVGFVFCFFIVLSSHAECACVISTYAKPDTVTIFPCKELETTTITASITCDSVTGTARGDLLGEGRKWVRTKAGKSETAEVELNGTCDEHQKSCAPVKVNITILYAAADASCVFGEKLMTMNSIHYQIGLGFATGERPSGIIAIETNVIPGRSLATPAGLTLYPGQDIHLIRDLSSTQDTRISELEQEHEALRLQLRELEQNRAIIRDQDGNFTPVIDPMEYELMTQMLQLKFDIEFIKMHPKGTVRQIRSTDGLVNIQPVDGNTYRILFYASADVAEEFDQNGDYAVTDNAEPIVTYTVANPDGYAKFNRISISETRDGMTDENKFAWANTSNGTVWSLIKGDGESRTTLVSNGNTKTWQMIDRDNVVVSQKQTTYTELACLGNDEEAPPMVLPVQTVEGVGISAKATTLTYFIDPLDPMRYGRVKTQIDPEGCWTIYDYDDRGREISVATGWLDGTLPGDDEDDSSHDPDPLAGRVVTSYVYTPFLPPDDVTWPRDDGTVDPATPRVETVTINGIPVSKTLRTVAMDNMGYRFVAEVRVLDPSSDDLQFAWENPVNPKTRTWYMPEDNSKPCSKKPERVFYPDGRTEFYSYTSGTYSPGDNGLPGSFEKNDSGKDFLTTITYGTETHSQGVPRQTTQTRVYARKSDFRSYLSETWVCSEPEIYERMTWNTISYDNSMRPVLHASSDGTHTSTSWDGNQIAYETAADGVRTDYEYDTLGRRVRSIRSGHDIRPDLVTDVTYDADNRVLSTTISSEGISLSTSKIYDQAGRLIKQRASDGVETAYWYGRAFNRSFTSVIHGYDTALATTNTTAFYPDGQIAYMEFNGVRSVTYEYGINEDGTRMTTEYEGVQKNQSPVWHVSIFDSLGRIIEKRRPGFNATLITRNTYDSMGRLLTTKAFSENANTHEITIFNSQMFKYNDCGDMVMKVQDSNFNDAPDFDGPDYIGLESSEYIFQTGDWWLETKKYAFPEFSSSDAVLMSTIQTQLSGLGDSSPSVIGDSIMTARSIFKDAVGNCATNSVFINTNSFLTASVFKSPLSVLPAYTISQGGVKITKSTPSGRLLHRSYDALGRQISSTDERGNVSYAVYDDSGRIAYTENAFGFKTHYGYDLLGRRVSITDSLGKTTHTEYDAFNRVVAEWGGTYPVAYFYDDYGRMDSLTTYRDDQHEGDTTKWIYHESTGLLIQKLFADGKGPRYTYTAQGQLASRTWARGVETTYTYNLIGDLINVDYSDATPSIAFEYDRLGRQISASTAGVSTNLYTYSTLGLLVNEKVTGIGASEISRKYDMFGRPSGITLDRPADYDVDYLYDEFGRIKSIELPALDFTYLYVPGTDLINGMTTSIGFAWYRTFEDKRNLTQALKNQYQEMIISQFEDVIDSMGRKTSRIDSGAAFSSPTFENYEYDIYSSLTSSQRYHGIDVSNTSTPFGGRHFNYTYDSIGNRVSSAETIGGETLTRDYMTNKRNQYATIMNPAGIGLRGEASMDATVTVNENSVHSDFVNDKQFWHHALPIENIGTSGFQYAEIMATTPDNALDSASGYLYSPPREETLVYDDDGNLIATGRWQYSWDGENRLISASEIIAPTNRPLRHVDYVYDHRGRMIAKTVASGHASSGMTTTYTWDFYNIVSEKKAPPIGGEDVTYNFWGLDLSGSFQGAGGVGGLIAVRQNGSFYLPAYDTSGNISEYISTDGTIVAHREYDPFGNTLHSSENMAFTYWFTTKPWCPMTQLIEFQLRLYNPNLGRWMSRDPAEERGGLNLYCFVNNNSVSQFDRYGLFFDDILDKLKDLGRDVIDGIDKGIDNAKELAKGLKDLISDLGGYISDQVPPEAVDDILQFALDAITNEANIELSTDILELIRNDDGMKEREQEIKDKVMIEIVDGEIRKPAGGRYIYFAHDKPNFIDGGVEFGGKRADGNMKDQLFNPLRDEYRDTWKVGMNPLTWMLRHARVRSGVKTRIFANCDHYFGTIYITHEIEDTLDLRPHGTDKNDFSKLADPKTSMYDKVTIILGTIWHDVLKRRDDIKIKGTLKSSQGIEGNWE